MESRDLLRDGLESQTRSFKDIEASDNTA